MDAFLIMTQDCGGFSFAEVAGVGFVAVSRWPGDEGKRLQAVMAYAAGDYRFTGSIAGKSLLSADGIWLHERTFHNPSPALFGLE